ncbi:protein translocase subunit SecDF [Spiroplasma endosymbiont of Agriotes lineatus]|uniref:protein translocase subunit SecDF n=1 Tax=Spiroplasma endosymbiont of Agriotes lineatus TaxID=3077930 RepID=UPI0030CAD054
MENNIKETQQSLWIRFGLFIILILSTITSLITSSFFVKNNFRSGMLVGGTYQTIVSYENAKNRHGVVNTLQDKIDPLRKKRMDISHFNSNIGGNRLNVMVPQANYGNIADFLRDVERSGSIFFLDDKGDDLLVGTGTGETYKPAKKDGKRIVLKDFIDSSSINNSLISGINKPSIEFKIKNLKLYNVILKYQDKKSVYVWQDFGQMLDEMRSNYSDLIKFRKFINAKALALQGVEAQDLRNALRSLLMASVRNRKNGDVKEVNLADQGVNTDSDIYNYFQNNDVTFNEVLSYNKNSPNSDLTIDINNEDDTYDKQRYLNPFRPFLVELVNTEFKDVMNNKYKNKYLITSSSLQLKPNNSDKVNDIAFIEISGEEAAAGLAKIFSAGIKGITYQVESYSVSDTIISNATKVIMIITVSVILLIILVILAVFYRVLGLILGLILATMIVVTIVVFNVLLGIYGWEVFIAMLIGIMIALSSSIILLERMKTEFNGGKSLIQSFLDANRKSISTIFDMTVLILTISFFIYWFGTGIIKSFAIMLIISILGAFIFGIVLIRGIYYSLLSLNWINNRQDLVMTNFVIIKQKIHHVIKKIGFNKITHFSKKFSYQKSFKWLVLLSTIIISCGAIVVTTAGPVTSLEFTHGTIFQVQTSGHNITSADDEAFLKAIEETKNEIITKFKTDYSTDSYSLAVFRRIEDRGYNIVIKTFLIDNKYVNSLQTWLSENNFQSEMRINDVSYGSLWNETSGDVVIDGIIVLAVIMVIILIYLIIRFDWSFILPLILTIIHDVLLTCSLIIICRFEVTIEVVTAILAVVIFAIIHKIIIFDRVRENKIGLDSTKMNKSNLSDLVNTGFTMTLKSSLIVLSLVLLLSMTLFVIGQNIGAAFALLLGSVIGIYSSTILLRWLWVYVANIKRKLLWNKKQKIYKSLTGPDEQIVFGVND